MYKLKELSNSIHKAMMMITSVKNIVCISTYIKHGFGIVCQYNWFLVLFLSLNLCPPLTLW